MYLQRRMDYVEGIEEEQGLCACMHAYIQRRMHAYIRTYIHTYIHTHLGWVMCIDNPLNPTMAMTMAMAMATYQENNFFIS